MRLFKTQMKKLKILVEFRVFVTWVDGTDSIGKRFGTSAAEISWEERKPRGEKLGSNSEFWRLIIEKERVGFGRRSLRFFVSFVHGGESTRFEESETRDRRKKVAYGHKISRLNKILYSSSSDLYLYCYY